MTSPPPTFFSLSLSLVVSLSYWTLHTLKGSFLLLYRSTRLATTSSSQKGEALQTVHDRRDTLKKESSVDSPRQKRYLQKGPRNWDRHARSSASPASIITAIAPTPACSATRTLGRGSREERRRRCYAAHSAS